MKRFALSTLCTFVLAAGACTDTTQPPGTQEDSDPSFSHGGPSETICALFITGIHDNVTVPPGGTCFVNGATILGNIKALQDANLFVVRSTVHGNVEGDGPDALQVLAGTTVGCNVFVTGAGITPPIGGFTTVFIGTVCGEPEDIVTIGGDVHILKGSANTIFVTEAILTHGSLKVEDNFTLGLLLLNNQVGQNLQVFKNQGGQDRDREQRWREPAVLRKYRAFPGRSKRRQGGGRAMLRRSLGNCGDPPPGGGRAGAGRLSADDR